MVTDPWDDCKVTYILNVFEKSWLEDYFPFPLGRPIFRDYVKFPRCSG